MEARGRMALYQSNNNDTTPLFSTSSGTFRRMWKEGTKTYYEYYAETALPLYQADQVYMVF